MENITRYNELILDISKDQNTTRRPCNIELDKKYTVEFDIDGVLKFGLWERIDETDKDYYYHTADKNGSKTFMNIARGHHKFNITSKKGGQLLFMLRYEPKNMFKSIRATKITNIVIKEA